MTRPVEPFFGVPPIKPFRGLQVECWDHDDEEVIIGFFDVGQDGSWFLVPSSRAFPHSSIVSDRASAMDGGQQISGIASRWTLRCSRCMAERRDQPATVRAETLDRLVERMPRHMRDGNKNRGGDRLIVTRRLLIS